MRRKHLQPHEKELLEMANADYEMEKTYHGNTHKVNIRMIEREWDLPIDSLRTFRKNSNRVKQKREVNFVSRKK